MADLEGGGHVLERDLLDDSQLIRILDERRRKIHVRWEGKIVFCSHFFNLLLALN
jgi:hypothetical protein